MRKTTMLGTLSCLALLSLIAAAPVIAAPGWTGPRRVAADYYPLSPSAVLKAGVLHVAYLHQQGSGSDQPNGIFYASNAGGTWHTERVTTGDDFYARPSLAVDDAGKASIAFARVCFCEPLTSSIWIATNRAGPWQLGQRTKDAEDLAPSLRFAGGALHLAFQRKGVGVVYQSKATGSWVSSTVVSAAGACYIEQFPSLVVDPAGKAWVAYERPRFGGCAGGGSSANGIRVATNASGSWVSTAVSSDLNDYLPSLASSPTGGLHVAFERYGTGIEYSRRQTNGTWTSPALAAVGNDVSLAVDANGTAHIAYEGSGPAYATYRTGAWVATPLASYSLDYGTSSPVRVVLTNTGKARVVFGRAEGTSEDDFGLYLAKEL